jgi:FKBP-type peptidyl-prolyl cis-trans isomerase FkpA
MKYILSALVLTLYVLFKDKETDYVAQNEEEISAYVENNLTAQRSDSGLYYIINNGNGVRPTANSTVKWHTKAILLMGLYLTRVQRKEFRLD